MQLRSIYGLRSSERSRVSIRLSRLTVLAVAGLVALASSPLVSVASAALAHQRNAAKAVVKPNFSYFSGKTITIVAPGSAGTGYDELARIVAPALGSYLHCTVVVENISNAIQAQNTSMASQANGLTIGLLNPTADIENFVEKTAAFTFSLKSQNFLAGIPASDNAWVAWGTSSYQSIQQILSPAGPIKFLDTNSGFVDLQNRVIFGAYGLPTSSLVSGFGSPAALLQGFVGLDAPLADIAMANVESILNAGLARPLMLAFPLKPGNLGYALLHKLKVPTYASLFASKPPKGATAIAAMKELLDVVDGVNMIFATPTATPMPFNLALTAALKSVLHQKGTSSLLNAVDLGTGYYSPKEIADDLNVEIKKASAMAPYLPVQ